MPAHSCARAVSSILAGLASTVDFPRSTLICQVAPLARGSEAQQGRYPPASCRGEVVHVALAWQTDLARRQEGNCDGP